MSTKDTKQRLLEVLSIGMTRDEILAVYKHMIDQILKLEKKLIGRNEQSSKLFNEKITSLIEKTEQSLVKRLDGNDTTIKQTLQSFKQAVDAVVKDSREAVNKLFIEQAAGMNFIKDKVSKIRDGIDGHTPTDTELIALISKLLPEIPEIIHRTPEQTRDDLEKLQGEEKLKKDAIDGLKEELEELKKEMASIPRGRGGARGKSYYTTSIDLSSQLDGSTKSFTLPKDTVEILMVEGTQFPQTWNKNDWTFAGNTLTIPDGISAPEAGQSLMVLVNRQFFG